MPQRSKTATNQAISKVARSRAARARGAAKAPQQGSKRSAAVRPKVRSKAKPAAVARSKAGTPARKVVPRQGTAVARKATPKVARAAGKQATRKAAASSQAPSARRAARAVVAAPSKRKPGLPARSHHALILPPKPSKRASRLSVAPAPRPPQVIERAPETAQPAPARPQAPANALGLQARAAVLRMRARKARARLTQDTWREIDRVSARLGRAQLDDEQRVAIRAALEGHDSLIVQPDDERAITCYELAAQLLEQPTVVISPQHSALKAQAEALSQRSFAVVLILPEHSDAERGAAISRIARGGSLLVLLSPEGLRAADVRQALAASGIALLVAEEAHCASEASQEFRPSYAELAEILRAFDSPPVMALTRVATAAVRHGISRNLGLNAPVTVVSSPVRDNLQIVTKLARGESRQAALVRLVERLELPGLVLCATAHDADSVYAALRGAGIAAHRQHSGMTPSDRAAELLNFTLPGRRSVLVCVSAFAPSSGLPGIGEHSEAHAGFGRGPSRRDLRFVVHYQSPASIEQYLREIQQAGGDGLPALCVLLHESSHRSLHEVMQTQQRFKASHLAELGRALETPTLEQRTVTLEALALGTGQSRRTTDRLTALLTDAGVLSRAGGSVRVLCSAAELDETCRRVGAQLYALREQDARRLASLGAFAESGECKRSCLSQYLGEGLREACGQCSACNTAILEPSQESLLPPASARLAAAQGFSIETHSAPRSGVVMSGAVAPSRTASPVGNR